MSESLGKGGMFEKIKRRKGKSKSRRDGLGNKKKTSIRTENYAITHQTDKRDTERKRKTEGERKHEKTEQ